MYVCGWVESSVHEIVSIMATRVYICYGRSVSIAGTEKKANVVNAGEFLHKIEG
ncbi:hypothetical protein PISMIDRAFT_377859 [Pisolithus microcarpus 441]|uniref:Uncharacterized protein n=1 Tax=Pisolithus microcarpus 441 TaxID=765257 RepID=A0A0C9ZYM9_9AGAM|nr:hypothetical protein PISMIDRAFT_377859 [Pisolithus microcarpus 441]